MESRFHRHCTKVSGYFKDVLVKETECPLRQPYGPTLFAQAARDMGYKPFRVPSALISEPYTNSRGVTMGPCTFCGFGTNYCCANYSKASAITKIIPVLVRKSNFACRTNSEVFDLRP